MLMHASCNFWQFFVKTFLWETTTCHTDNANVAKTPYLEVITILRLENAIAARNAPIV